MGQAHHHLAGRTNSSTPRPFGPPRERHCYVTGAPGAAGEHSGLLLAWRRDERVWTALVAYVVQEGPVEAWTLVQQWLPAEFVRPAD